MDVDEVSENPEDKRKSRSPSKKLSENYIDFLEEELESNSKLKNNAMVKLLKDKFGIKVSESTIRRALQEHEYHYIGPKICQKNIWKKMQERLDWCRRHLDKYWHNIFFTDETTVYVDNPSGDKRVKKNEKYIEYK